MDCLIEREAEKLLVTIAGKWSFSDAELFAGVIEAAKEEEVEQVEINLEELAFIDSSGLGMLLMLRNKSKAKIALISPQKHMQKMIHVTQLDKLFDVQ